MKRFSLDHLTDVEFEEFCFDLLIELGFTNVRWRKGTGLSTSPSDRGRDIECQREQTDVDGHKEFEKWFVECKHSIRGVPPDRIQGALAWAAAQRPDKLLIIASNFLSNPTHDFIESYEQNNRPSFKIKKWERTDLERMSAGRTKLIRKYNVSGDLTLLSIMHPVHLSYIRELRFNSLKYLFDVLDKLDSQPRDKALDWAF
jgi:Restriction endonuclease